MHTLWKKFLLSGLLAGQVSAQPLAPMVVDPPEAVLWVGETEVHSRAGGYPLPLELFPNKTKPVSFCLRAPGYRDKWLDSYSWEQINGHKARFPVEPIVMEPLSWQARFRAFPWAGFSLALPLLYWVWRRRADPGRAVGSQASQARDPKPEERLHSSLGGYRLVSVLGQGGMAFVYRAEDRHGRPVALKTIRSEQKTAGFVQRFQREVLISKRLEHPNVVSILDWGEEDGILFLVMELVEGQTLQQRLAAGPCEFQEACRILEKIVEGVAYAHSRGIIHRDIKPANVIVTPDGEVKLVDFGLARSREVQTITSTGSVVGTPAYMAPEQLINGPSRDALTDRSDQYSLAILSYELLTGRRPFEKSNQTELLNQHLLEPPPPIRRFCLDLSPEFEAVLLRMLAKDPSARFESVREAGLALLEASHARLDSTRLEATGPPQGLPDQDAATEIVEVARDSH